MKFLIIINDAPYGTEKAYNALRLAMTLQKEYDDAEVSLFLIADAVGAAIPNQKTADGYYNIERMLKGIINNKGVVKACGSCLDARGIAGSKLIDGAERSTMKELSALTYQADKVVTF